MILRFEKVDIMDGNNKQKVQEVKRNCLIISRERELQKPCMSAFSAVEMLRGRGPLVQPRRGIKAGCWPSAVFMNKWSLDTLPSLNLAAPARADPVPVPGFSICFPKSLDLLA